jgi:acyl carrier protein
MMVTVEKRVRDVVDEISKLPDDAGLDFALEKLGLDSLDAADLVLDLEAEFMDEKLHVEDGDVSSWKTLGDVVDYVGKRLSE